MTHQKRLAWLNAEKNEITSRMEDPDNPFAKISLRSRLEQVEAELEALVPTEEQRTLGKTKLLFRGRPVVGRKGVFADFGLEASESFQRAVHRRSSALARSGSRGMLAPPNPLAIVNIARGSFGFVFEEIIPEPGLLQGPSHAAQALAEIQEIIDLARTGDESTFIERMQALDGGTAQGIRDFLDTVDSAGATFRVWTEDREVGLEEQEIAAATHWIQRIGLATEEIEFNGVLSGLFTVSRKFEFVPDGRRVLHGQLDEETDSHSLAPWIEQRCLARFKVERKRRASSRKPGPPKWILVSITAPTTAAPDPLLPVE